LANAPYRSQSFRFVERNLAGEAAATARAAAEEEREASAVLREVNLVPPEHHTPAHATSLRSARGRGLPAAPRGSGLL